MPKRSLSHGLLSTQEQDVVKNALGEAYQDYHLVIASELGRPVEGTRITSAFKRLIEANNLPPVVFHSLRHSSITYKLKLTGGDIKAVQGDSGHARAKMITGQYSHILDESRVENARLIEEAFYDGHGATDYAGSRNASIAHDAEKDEKPTAANEAALAQQVIASGVDLSLLKKLLDHPEMLTLLQSLSATLGK